MLAGKSADQAISCTRFQKRVIHTCVFAMIFAVEFVVSQPSNSSCVLNFQNRTSLETGEGGTWGGFLSEDYCNDPFKGYLYALTKRANATGKIYLNSTQQTDCLNETSEKQEEIKVCGIEKLTSDGRGCSDLTVDDVSDRLGDDLKSLGENCEFHDMDSNNSCRYCIDSWENIKGMQSGDTFGDYICRFSVLVSLASTKVEDLEWIRNTYKCLSKKDTGKDPEAKPTKEHHTGTTILVGALTLFTLSVVILALVLSRRWNKIHAPAKQDGLKLALPKKSRCLRVPIKEVYAATNNLNQMNFIGEGTSGKVYKGIMSNKQHVAVKHIINDGFVETFLREVRNLSHVRHPNLVTLLGYCDNVDECFHIYELCPNGNLSEWLFGKNKTLSWIQRVEIAIDCARGLWFLHTYSGGCIVHRDIKPTNILLGANFEAKLSDFGLSKVIDIGETHVSSEVRGTFGYVDPEYQSDRQVNSAGDVYSFGIVLLQILSGKKVINMNMKRPMPLGKMAKSLTRDSSIRGFADPKLEGDYSAEAFDFIFKLALTCTGLKQQRPSMGHVVQKLEAAHELSMSGKASTSQSSPGGSPTP